MTGRELEDDDDEPRPVGELVAALLLVAIVVLLAWITWLAWHVYGTGS